MFVTQCSMSRKIRSSSISTPRSTAPPCSVDDTFALVELSCRFARTSGDAYFVRNGFSSSSADFCSA